MEVDQEGKRKNLLYLCMIWLLNFLLYNEFGTLCTVNNTLFFYFLKKIQTGELNQYDPTL